MTHTADHDCVAQAQHMNGVDVEYREPAKPTRRPFLSGKELMDLFMRLSESQRATRAAEQTSTVTVLDKLIENTDLAYLDSAVHNMAQAFNDSELAAGLKRVHYAHQYLVQSIADEFRVTSTGHRH